MGKREHHGLVVHKRKHVFRQQKLQTGREILVRPPEAKNDRQKREKRQLVSRVCAVQRRSAQRPAGGVQRGNVPVKKVRRALKKIRPSARGFRPEFC